MAAGSHPIFEICRARGVLASHQPREIAFRANLLGPEIPGCILSPLCGWCAAIVVHTAREAREKETCADARCASWRHLTRSGGQRGGHSPSFPLNCDS